MKIQTALILCAGYGKRLNPITLKTPKPLIKVYNKELLSRAIELMISIGIKNIKINSFYLSDKIKDFVKSKNFLNNIEVINDGNNILDTGGGIKNMINHINDENFVVINPDTVWDSDYKKITLDMIDFFQSNKLKSLLMVVDKKKSFDERFKGDFLLKDNLLSKGNISNYIYTGFQILNRSIFNEREEKKFSVNKIWDSQIKLSQLFGYESKNKFIHLTDLEIYNRILKNN